MRALAVLLVVAFTATAAFANGDDNIPGEPLASVKQVMLGLTIPASNVVWNVVFGEEKTDWEKVEANAMTLAESGRLLMEDGRAVDDGEWMKYARAMIDSSLEAAEFAGAEDLDALRKAGNALYESCDGCHKKYMPARQGEQ